MHIRLAALIVVIAALLLSFNSPSRLEAKYAELNTTCLGNKGGTTTVVSACNTLMEVEGVTPEGRGVLLRARGWAYYCDRQYQKALSDYSSALALQPDDGITILRRAIVHDALGNTQAAEAGFTKRLLMDPDGRDPLFYKAKFDYRQGNISEAIQGYERILDVYPDDSGAATQLKAVVFESDGSEGVTQVLHKAKQRWPEQAWVHDLDLQYHLDVTGDHVRALNAVSEIVRLKSNTKLELPLRAYVYLKIGDEKTGIEYVREYAARQNAEDDSNQGFFLKRWFDDAIEWYLWRNSQELMLRGFFFALVGRPDLAKPELELALNNFGVAGRRELLDVFAAKGVSVPQHAYAGSPEHLKIAVSEYVLRIGKMLVEPHYWYSK